jgi:hypothetical protein
VQNLSFIQREIIINFWDKTFHIGKVLRETGKQSIRSIARRTGFSRSSVQRLKQGINQRNQHPESWLWETEDGRIFLIRLVIATLYTFGLKRGVGAETISEFFYRLRINTHIGSSPSALRDVMHDLEKAILETAEDWERKSVADGKERSVIGAVDETFLKEMMLVFMDLPSGYLLFEKVADNRRYDTWQSFVAARLAELGAVVQYLVSDRAKALIKLAKTGQGCLSVPDLFHILQDLTKSYSLSIASRLKKARKQLEKCQASLGKNVEDQQTQILVAAREEEVTLWKNVLKKYREHLENLSCIVHPWHISGLTPQDSKQVKEQLQAEVDALEELADTHELPAKEEKLTKVRKQLGALSAVVDFWWQGVWHDLQQLALTPMSEHWVVELLLPLIYWQVQLSRTRCPRRKARISEALESVRVGFETHPVTRQMASDDVLADWQAWAAEHVKTFHRTSSAVEGRNGYLSQMQHNHRGLPRHRHEVWTVLHNFDCRDQDGTTPAARFFGRSFPDLFETVLAKIDDLPRPRQRKRAVALSC